MCRVLLSPAIHTRGPRDSIKRELDGHLFAPIEPGRLVLLFEVDPLHQPRLLTQRAPGCVRLTRGDNGVGIYQPQAAGAE